VFLAVRTISDLRVGHSFSLTWGFYRQVCSNGLVSEILGLGAIRMSHAAFSVGKVRQFLSSIPRTSDLSRWPRLDSEVAVRLSEMLTADDQDMWVSPLVSQHLIPLKRHMSRRHRESFRQELTSGLQGPGVLVLLNAMTTNAPNRVYSRVDSLLEHMVSLADLVAFKYDRPSLRLR